jgi:hypothetical protein
VHEVHGTVSFMGISREHVTFPHVHDVHEVHEVHDVHAGMEDWPFLYLRFADAARWPAAVRNKFFCFRLPMASNPNNRNTLTPRTPTSGFPPPQIAQRRRNSGSPGRGDPDPALVGGPPVTRWATIFRPYGAPRNLLQAFSFQSAMILMSKNGSHCRLGGWTGTLFEAPVLRLLPHLEVVCQREKQKYFLDQGTNCTMSCGHLGPTTYRQADQGLKLSPLADWPH